MAALGQTGIAQAMEQGGAVDGPTAGGYLYHSARICRVIAGSKICVDFGCGTGAQLLQVAQLNPSIKFIGVDCESKLLTLGKANAEKLGVKNVEWLMDDITSPTCLADRQIDALDNRSLPGQFLGGALLGAVWSPCVGPTLGGAISLASQGRDLTMAALTMTSFAAGVASIILAFGYGTRALLTRSRGTLRAIATTGRPVMGAVFALTGAVLFFHLNRPVEIWLIDNLPIWLQDFSVSI